MRGESPVSARHGVPGALGEVGAGCDDDPLFAFSPPFGRVRTLGIVTSATILSVLMVGAVLAPAVSPEDYASFSATAGNLSPRMTLPGLSDWRYILGADAQGHSILMWVMYGGRLSLLMALLSSTLACLIASLLSRIMTVRSFLCESRSLSRSLPLFLLACILFKYAEHVWAMVAFFAAAAWPSQLPFVQSLTAPTRWRSILGRVLLLVAPLLVVQATIDFLGFGVQPPQPSWGRALYHASDYMGAGNWWWIVFPGAALAGAVVSFHYLGHALAR